MAKRIRNTVGRTPIDEVIEALQAADSALTSKQIYERCTGFDNTTRVAALLNRLWAQGHIVREATEGGRLAYRKAPVKSEATPG